MRKYIWTKIPTIYISDFLLKQGGRRVLVKITKSLPPHENAALVISITEDDSKQDQILLVKIHEYIGFCVHRRSCLLGSPVIVKEWKWILNWYHADPLHLFKWPVVPRRGSKMDTIFSINGLGLSLRSETRIDRMTGGGFNFVRRTHIHSGFFFQEERGVKKKTIV